MVKFKASKIFFITIFFLTLQRSAVCQDEYVRDTIDTNKYEEEYYDENDSADYVYPDYYRVAIFSGYSSNDNLKLSTYSNRFYININYSYSIFPRPLEYIPTQVGLYNEIGLYNTSVYFNIGPEIRVRQYFYLIPYAGISLVPFAKNDDEDISIIYYLGAAAGCIVNLNKDMDIILEAATDFINFKHDKNNAYLKIGISYNLFYPL